MPINPNREFRRKKHPHLPKNSDILRIICEATNCGHTMIVTRRTWSGPDEIECPMCGEAIFWSIIRKKG